MTLPNPAPDLGGACSLLFSLGGLTVIHDAAGCMENYAVYDEPRWFGASAMVYSSGLSQMDAVLGNEKRLVDQLCRAVSAQHPAFAAILGSPVPYTLGMDLDGMAREVSARTHIPAFGLECGGFSPYPAGVDAALLSVAQSFCAPRAADGSVNLLGATPMDFTQGDLRVMEDSLHEAGIRKVRVLSMGASLGDLREAAAAKGNLVVSAGGIGCAQWMRSRFGIPYAIGIPLTGEMAALLMAALRGEDVPRPAPADGGCLVLGEQVFAQSLAWALSLGGIPAVPGATIAYDPRLTGGLPVRNLEGEDGIVAALSLPWKAVVGDPLYEPLLPGGISYIGRPHPGLSSRLFSNRSLDFSKLLKQVKEIVK